MNWLKELYAKLAFQNRYDTIKSWKLTPQQQALSDSIWDNLSPTIQKALWSLVALILAKYGPEKAQALWGAFLNAINKENIVV
jgi:hypothetical protein